MSLKDVHANWAWMMLASNAVAGLWALGAHWLAPLRVRALWWFVVVAEVSIFVQVALGVTLVTAEGMQAPQFHMFYGFVAIITVAILYAYRNQMRPWMYLLYGFGSLFLMGLGIRAMLKG